MSRRLDGVTTDARHHATLKVQWDAERRHGHVELGLERAREAVRVALGFNELRLRIPGVGLARVRVGSKRPGDLLEKFQIGLRRFQPFSIARRAAFQRSNFSSQVRDARLRRRVHHAARARGEPLLVDVALPS